MGSELAIYDRMDDPLVAIEKLGDWISQSGIFNLENPAQGKIFAMECMTKRVPPFSLAERYHLIKGQLSMKVDVELAEFNRAGGTHKIVCRTPDEAAVELSIDGKTNVFRFTWAEAQAEPFVYLGKEADVVKMLLDGKKPPMKPKYATPRSRMQMLWARCVGDVIKATHPIVNSGLYTPEEVEDFDDELPHETNGTAAKPKGRRKPATATATVSGQGGESSIGTASTAAGNETDANVVDAEYEVKRDDAGVVKPTVEPSASAPGGCSAEQSNRIKELWGLLGATPEQRERSLKKRNVEAVRSLTKDQASELIMGLTAKYEEISQQAAVDAVTSLPDPGKPCLPEQAAAIRRRMTELEQVHKGMCAQLKSKIDSAGLKTLNDLTSGEAQELLDAIAGGATEAFFGQSLWPAKRTPATPGQTSADSTPAKN
jgi:hypothetical protein